jgi:hypothetical protein
MPRENILIVSASLTSGSTRPPLEREAIRISRLRSRFKRESKFAYVSGLVLNARVNSARESESCNSSKLRRVRGRAPYRATGRRRRMWLCWTNNPNRTQYAAATATTLLADMRGYYSTWRAATRRSAAPPVRQHTARTGGADNGIDLV